MHKPLPVISTSQVSAPAFVAAVMGKSVHQCIQMDGQTVQLADLRVSGLSSRTIAGLQKEFGVTVVLHKKSSSTPVMADPDTPIHPGDTLVVAAFGDRMQKLEAANRG